jgi:hypothetical protein
MRFVKLAIISAVVLFLITLGISSLIPSHVRISRAVNMHASQDSIIARVLNIQDWQGWNDMVKNIPPAKFSTASSN